MPVEASAASQDDDLFPQGNSVVMLFLEVPSICNRCYAQDWKQGRNRVIEMRGSATGKIVWPVNAGSMLSYEVRYTQPA